MNRVFILSCGLALVAIAPSQAGEVLMLGSGPEMRGKLSLADSGTIAVASPTGASPDKVSLADVLVADFSDTPFHIDYFSSVGSQSTGLPSDWRMKDLAPVDVAGGATYANGELSMHGPGSQLAGEDDLFFFAGRPWQGNGEWTIRMKSYDPAALSTETGLMLRQSLDTGALMYCAGETVDGGGWFQGRNKVGEHAGWVDIGVNEPGWLRMTRTNGSVDTAVSPDGVKWQLIGQTDITLGRDFWIGILLNSRQEKVVGKATVDEIEFRPSPPVTDAVPPGALLVDGSYLAGYFDLITTKDGSFNRSGKRLTLSSDKVAAIIIHPTTRQELTGLPSPTGLLMKNGDFLDSELDSINGTYVQSVSTTLGPVSYYSDTVRACLLRPVKAKESAFEVRLTDGSIIRASGFDTAASGITIHTGLGLDIPVAPEEIAQIRAGLTRVQPLMALAWKSSSADVAKAPAPAPANPAAPADKAGGVAAAPAPAQAVPAPVAAAGTPDIDQAVETWGGNDQEQIMAATMGTAVTFPLKGKFGQVALRVAVGPDSDAGTKVTLHVLADGREIGGGSVTAGDPPLFMKAALGNSQALTLTAESSDSRAKILFIDPVALK